MISILRRRGLGNGSTKAIQKCLESMGKFINIMRHDARGWKIFTFGHWRPIAGAFDDFAIRWGYTGEAGFDDAHTINLSKHIHLVNNKSECRKKLSDADVNVPSTFFDKETAAEYMEDGCVGKLIGRPTRHAQGRNLVVVKTLDDLARDRTSNYWSEFIDKDKEFRVYTFFGKIIMVAEKEPTQVGRERVAWNHFGGGATFKNVLWRDWPITACVESLKASNAIGIDFAGVDVMVKNNEAYILEINSAHSLTSEYRQKTFAKAVNWLIDNMEGGKPEHFAFPEHIRTYKSLILPCLRETREETD